MGLSKTLTELCVQDLARPQSGRDFPTSDSATWRAARAAWCSIFWDQIQKGGPIRVTDPRATRYFMSVPEAVHLILRAAALGKGGETFVFDMGEPVNIYELAKTMILFAGLKPDPDVAIEFIGLNGGEKIAEDLWEEWESPAVTEHSRILRIAGGRGAGLEALHCAGVMEAYLQLGDREGLLEYLEREVTPMLRRDPVLTLPVPKAMYADGIGLNRSASICNAGGRMKIPLSMPDIGEREIEAVTAVLRSGHLSLGPQLAEFEARFANISARAMPSR